MDRRSKLPRSTSKNSEASASKARRNFNKPSMRVSSLSIRTSNTPAQIPSAKKTYETPKKDQLLPIKYYILERNSSLRSLHCPSTKEFVDACNIFREVLCGPDEYRMTVQNYQEVLPQMLKCFGYATTLKTSTLKYPNVPSSLTQILPMWTFLLELCKEVDTIYDPELDPKQQAVMDLRMGMIDTYELQEIVFEGNSLENLGNFDEFLEKQQTEFDELQMQIKELTEILSKTHEEYKYIIEEIEKLNPSVIADKIRAVEEKLQEEQENKNQYLSELAEVKERIVQPVEKMEPIEVNEIKIKLLDLDIQSEKKKFGLLKDRNEKLKKQYEERQRNEKQYEDDIMTIIYQINTSLMMNSLTEIKADIMYDENNLLELTLEQVQSRTAVIVNYEKKAQEIVTTTEAKSVQCERQIAEIHERKQLLQQQIEEKLLAHENNNEELLNLQAEHKSLIELKHKYDEENKVFIKTLRTKISQLREWRKKCNIAGEVLVQLKEGTKQMKVENHVKVLNEEIKSLTSMKEKKEKSLHMLQNLQAGILMPVHVQ